MVEPDLAREPERRGQNAELIVCRIGHRFRRFCYWSWRTIERGPSPFVLMLAGTTSSAR
jgi:hypothetical protein